ncbi:hypothetical protein D9757_000441 [Collybiopsis confluens]|uniref:Uncharacterized protein n=1 Tax=Collybiopsis confluens TaxID=2823264 RepID=A0A8H5MH94_9AGAR|nr:hypothetical protein D9757_000441 [Collybiopsis confluens]
MSANSRSPDREKHTGEADAESSKLSADKRAINTGDKFSIDVDEESEFQGIGTGEGEEEGLSEDSDSNIDDNDNFFGWKSWKSPAPRKDRAGSFTSPVYRLAWRPSKVRHLMSAHGEVGRILNGPIYDANTLLRRKPHFTEGWVEFKDKKIARVSRSSYTHRQVTHRVVAVQVRATGLLKNVELARVLEKRIQKKKEKGEEMALKPNIQPNKRRSEEEAGPKRKRTRANEDGLDTVLNSIF